jgi:DnaJ-class molecular chaperone
MTKQITLKEALCGFSVEIPHLNGKTIRISNLSQQNVVKPGFVREINHFGMLDKNNPSKNGKLILDFEIIFPETLTEEQKKTIASVL